MTSEADWQHGLRLYQAYDRDAGVKDIKDTIDGVRNGGDTEKYLGEAGGLTAPLLMHLAKEDEFISKAAQAEIRATLAKNSKATVYSYPSQNHAFSRHGGAHYNAEAAALAHERTYAFLNRQIRCR